MRLFGFAGVKAGEQRVAVLQRHVEDHGTPVSALSRRCQVTVLPNSRLSRSITTAVSPLTARTRPL